MNNQKARTITLFRAYQKAMFWRGFYRESRGTTFGIGVETDRYALQFQRYDRQAGKLEKRIAERLEQAELTPDVPCERNTTFQDGGVFGGR